MLWKLNKDDIESSDDVPITNLAKFGLTEEHLEKFLWSRLGEVIAEEHLLLIARERKGQEAPDLLALDKEGRLYIFELKRWESNAENLLQVLRYGQKFGRYTYAELKEFAQRNKELPDDSSLAAWHTESFGIERLEERRFNQDQVFVLVTNGTDEDTISAVDYWSSKGLKVVCAPYRVYEIDKNPYLQLDPYNSTGAVVVEREPRYFIVNTNKKHMPEAWRDMIGDCKVGKAAAYYDNRWRVSKIPEGATVFLYHTEIGVIAKGKAVSGLQKTDCGGDPDKEFHVQLEFDWALSDGDWGRAPKASQINQKLQTGHRFRPTAFAISRAMAHTIDAIARGN